MYSFVTQNGAWVHAACECDRTALAVEVCLHERGNASHCKHCAWMRGQGAAWMSTLRGGAIVPGQSGPSGGRVRQDIARWDTGSMARKEVYCDTRGSNQPMVEHEPLQDDLNLYPWYDIQCGPASQ